MIKCMYTMSALALKKLKKITPVQKPDKLKRKVDRFDGLTEEQVQKYTLPDYLETNLDIVFIGINPSLMAAHRGRYYAGPGNHFYKLLHESGLTPRCLNYEEDYKLPQYGIGLTNIVERATRSSSDIKRTEIKEGSKAIEEKLKYYAPKIAVFNGKCIYEVFANKMDEFNFGLQPENIADTTIWVTPSSSARCAHFPKMTDKLHFFTALKTYLQFLKGEIKNIDTKDFLFDGKCRQFIPRTSKMWRRKNVSAFLNGGRIVNKDTVCLDTSDENVAMAHSTEFIVKRIQSDKCENTEEISDTDISETESVQNTEVYVSQKNIEVFFQKDVLSQGKDLETINNPENNMDLIETHNLQKAMKSKEIKAQMNGKKNKRKLINVFQKPTISDFGKNADSDFVRLIKQRLEEKINHESIDNGHLKDKQIKSSHLKLKSQQPNSKSTNENINASNSAIES